MGKKTIEILIASIIVAGVAGVFIRVVGAIPFTVAQTTTNKASTFDATGEGKATVAPDRAQMSLGVRKSAPKVAAAQAAANETMQKVVADLKAMGVKEEDIKTTNYDIYPDYTGETGKPSGYVVSSQVMVKLSDFEKIPDALDLAGKYGLEQVGQLTFTLSDELRDKTLATAREEAVKAAKAKAENLAKLAGVSLGKIVNVQEGSAPMPVPMMYRADVAMESAAKTSAQVNPGTSELTVSVTLSYEIK